MVPLVLVVADARLSVPPAVASSVPVFVVPAALINNALDWLALMVA